MSGDTPLAVHLSHLCCRSILVPTRQPRAAPLLRSARHAPKCGSSHLAGFNAIAAPHMRHSGSYRPYVRFVCRSTLPWASPLRTTPTTRCGESWPLPPPCRHRYSCRGTRCLPDSYSNTCRNTINAVSGAHEACAALWAAVRCAQSALAATLATRHRPSKATAAEQLRRAFLRALPQVVTNTKAGESYVLYQCGTPQPEANAQGVSGIANPKYFQIPLYQVVGEDSTALAFMVSRLPPNAESVRIALQLCTQHSQAVCKNILAALCIMSACGHIAPSPLV